MVLLLFAFWVTLAWFTRAYLGRGARRWLYVATGAYALLSIANLVMPFTALYSSPPALRSIALPWGGRSVIAVGRLAWTGVVAFLASLAILLWSLGVARRLWRTGRRRDGLALGLGISPASLLRAVRRILDQQA
jgi:hypothetical protein